MTDHNWRAANARKASAARTLTKLRRWAGEMRAAGWRVTEPESPLSAETLVVLKNYAWLAQHRDAHIDWYSETVLFGDGGWTLDSLLNEGCTPGTRDE